ncbi:protein trichome birefringence-like 2 [Papaver somniferum]|uniref:protein trichome birefringence-like 2 n=1 Tax=Papaver somniferum TaxID=3469 RepID=UPI000E6FEBD6|nr:protein trichome birefringence-like 2 [Papaver somniferum]
MKTVGISEKLCQLVGISPPHHRVTRKYGSNTIILSGSRRKGSSVLFGFGCVLGVSILIITTIILMFPILSPSIMNPMLQNNINKLYQKISLSHSSYDTTTTTTTITSTSFSSSSLDSSQDLSEDNSLEANQTTIPSSLQESLENSTSVMESLENTTATDQTVIPWNSSSELMENSAETILAESNGTIANYSSAAKVEELVSTKAEDPVVSNISNNNEIKLYDGEKKQAEETSDTSSSSSQGHECNIFEGEWVKPVNNREPFYPPGTCPYIEQSPFDCYKNGRPEDAFLKLQWEWQSHTTNAGCNTNFPSMLNATDFLERLRNKKVAFAGDSLNRNMFESLMCILWNAVPDKSRVHWVSGYADYKIRGDKSLRYEDYNCTVGFVWSPYLVKETNPRNRRNETNKNDPEKMRLDMIDDHAASFYRDADLVIFDSWHWWINDKTNSGVNYFQEGDYLYPKLDMIKAYKKGLTTWRKWMDKNIDPNRTQVVFRGYSVNHFLGGKWNTGGKCNRELEPIASNETYREKSPPKVKILEDTIRKMKTPVIYLNVTKQTYYRTDGHPSLYHKNFKTYEERLAAVLNHQDCSHWCLPGIPDTWNELLYISLLRDGKGSFAR